MNLEDELTDVGDFCCSSLFSGSEVKDCPVAVSSTACTVLIDLVIQWN